MIKKSNIDFKIDRSKIEGIQDLKNDILPSHFLGVLCGKPGSGKTSLLKFLMTNENLLFKKYDYVYIISSSYREYKYFYLPKSNLIDHINWEWIKQKTDEINKNLKKYTNVLFIFDDVISEIYKTSKSKEILDFIFNRRHILENGMISILITSQKYKMIPTTIRSNITLLFAFKLNNMDWKQIKEELIFSDTNFDDIINYVFKDDSHAFLLYRIDTDGYYKNFDKILI